MSPSSTFHGGQHDTKYLTVDLLMHAAFLSDEIWGFMLEPARTCNGLVQNRNGEKNVFSHGSAWSSVLFLKARGWGHIFATINSAGPNIGPDQNKTAHATLFHSLDGGQYIIDYVRTFE